MSELPSGWALACISDLADINPKQDFDDHLPAGFVPMSHSPTNFHDKLRFEERNWGDIKKAYTNFKDGDVIFAKVTPCFENGKAALVEGLPNGMGAGSSEFFVLRPSSEEVSAKYLLALIKSREFMREGVANMTGAVGLRRVPRQFVEGFTLPVPPAAEQTRIAQKLDKLLAQVDTLKARIDAIPARIKRFRQSVLAAAISGRLTEEWRAQNVGRDNEGNRIAELSRDTDRLAPLRTTTPLPKVRLGDYCDVLGGKRLPKGYELTNSPTQFPYIRVTDFSEYTIDKSRIKYVPNDAASEIKKYIITDNDIYISIAGSIGLVGQVPKEFSGANLTENAARIVLRNGFDAKYLMYQLASPTMQDQMQEKQIATTQPKLGLFRIKDLELVKPNLEEQCLIASKVETLFAFADQLEAKVASAKSRIDHLTQSILAKAFRGELVPQDPNDEPASVLLERIKTQRATAPKVKRGRKSA